MIINKRLIFEIVNNFIDKYNLTIYLSGLFM